MSHMKRRLPIGIQDFVTIREEGFCYVDKTARIHQLITGSGRAFFLSRPRRFGKSLLCSTLRAIFEGRRELFQEIAGYPVLAINTLDWQWKKHPVIRLDLNAGAFSNGVEALHRTLYSELQAQSEKFGIELEKADVISQFKYLIRKACDTIGEKAVVIVTVIVFLRRDLRCTTPLAYSTILTRQENSCLTGMKPARRLF